MGEDVTRLKKNIENIKKVMQGGRKVETEKEETPAKETPVKRPGS